MAEYINRKAAISRIKQYCMDAIDGGRYSLDAVDDGIDLVNGIKALHAADVVPVVHGRWTETDWVEMESGGHELIKTPKAALRCSNCRNCFKKELFWKNNFCPNCGAKMDKKEATHD